MSRPKKKFEFEPAFDIKNMIMDLAPQAKAFSHIDLTRVFCFRSYHSTSRAIARIWSLPRIWQQALGIEAHYVIEVISSRFDKLSSSDQKRVLIHELMHIPQTFSGALVPHRCFNKRINHKSVENIYNEITNHF